MKQTLLIIFLTVIFLLTGYYALSTFVVYKKDRNTEEISTAYAFIVGNVYTANKNMPSAELVVSENDLITYVGPFEESVIPDNAMRIEQPNGLLLPGFIDNHNHIFEGGEISQENFCELENNLTLEEHYDQLEDCSSSAKPGEWITGFGHSLELVLSESPDDPTPLEVLDTLFPDNPVVFMEETSHSMIVNSLALDKAEFLENSEDPPGGVLMRNPNGTLNGIVLDNAGDIIIEIAESESIRSEIREKRLKKGMRIAREAGITTIGDGRLYLDRGWLETWRTLEANEELTARVSLRPWIYPHKDLDEQLSALKAIRTHGINELLVIDQVKFYSDGIVHNGTAKLIEPYQSTPLPFLPRGLNYIDETTMGSLLKSLSSIGYGAHIHTIGDGAVRESLNAIEFVRTQGSPHDYTLTHVELVDNQDIERFKQHGVSADFQPLAGEKTKESFSPSISQKRLDELHVAPYELLQNLGTNITLSSDWNVGPIDPIKIIRHAALSTNLTIEEAIDAYTINAAKSLGLEEITGSIEVGKSADLVLLPQDFRSKEYSRDDKFFNSSRAVYLQGKHLNPPIYNHLPQ